MPTLHVNGIDLFYDDHPAAKGSGETVESSETETVLLLTGLGGVGKSWGSQVDLFTARYRTVIPDHRGTGQSSKPANGYSVENLATDMAELVRSLDCGPVHVVGSSTGGAIAQVMALDHVDVVSSITLANSWAKSDDYFRHQFLARKQVLEAGGVDAYTRTSALFLFSVDYLRDRHQEVERWCHVAAASGTPEEIMAKRIDMIIEFDQRDRLDAIRVPALVLVGDADICTPPYYSEELAKRIPGAKLEILSGGHLIYTEAPAEFHAAVASFLDALE